MGRLQAATALAVVTGIVVTLVGPARAEERARKVLRIGLAGSLIQELPGAHSPLTTLAWPTSSINRLAEQQTGVPTHVIPVTDPDRLGRLLVEGGVDFGLFQGVEFGWARQKYPALRALVLVVNERPDLRACLLVRRGSGIADFAGLRGHSCALAKGSRQHCSLFLESCCRRCGAAPGDHLSRLDTPRSANRAIEAVVKGEVDAAVVDEAAADCYREEKPGRFARLRVVQQSEVFPSAVVAYADGAIDVRDVPRIRDSLLRAARSPRARAGLTLCRLTGFEPVPDDYHQMTDEVATAYRPSDQTGPLDWFLAGASRLVGGGEKGGERAEAAGGQGGVRQVEAFFPLSAPSSRRQAGVGRSQPAVGTVNQRKEAGKDRESQ